MNPPEPITAEAAVAQGFVSLTTPFVQSEKLLLDSFLASLRGAAIVLVSVTGGIEVWRHRDELKKIQHGAAKSLVAVRGGGTE